MKKMFSISILLLVFCLLVTGCGNKNNIEDDNNKIKDEDIKIEMISPEDVKDIVDNYKDYPNVDIIDVREEDEYNDGHIEGSLNIPLGFISEINISTEREIIVYCQSGRRSHEAALELTKLGYKVKDMGGINNWKYDLED